MISQVQINFKILLQSRETAYWAVGSWSAVLALSRYPIKAVILKSVKDAFPLKVFALEEFIVACVLQEFTFVL